MDLLVDLLCPCLPCWQMAAYSIGSVWPQSSISALQVTCDPTRCLYPHEQMPSCKLDPCMGAPLVRASRLRSQPFVCKQQKS